MNTYYIYKITNTITRMSYIGQHKVPLKGECPRSYFGRGVKLKEAIKEYGRKNFTKEILEYIKDDEERKKVSDRERYWIKKENTLEPYGYNVLPGGIDGMTSEVSMRGALTRKLHGYKMSEETKKKISASNRGKKKSEEHKEHLSENHRCRKLRRIQHEDGTIEETWLQVSKIAEQYKTNHNTLMRYSAKKEFINGIYLLDVNPEEYQYCTAKTDKEKRKMLCKDPVVGDICTLCAMRNRRKRNREAYKNINLNNCIIKDDEHEVRTNN